MEHIRLSWQLSHPFAGSDSHTLTVIISEAPQPMARRRVGVSNGLIVKPGIGRVGFN